MAWSEQFFTRRRLTSKLKHLVLQRYVKEYAYHLGSKRPVVYYVDGFAGAGLYEDESIREEGSPLLIARLAQQIKASPRPFDLRCLNVESNRKRFQSLERATEIFPSAIIEKNYHSAFADVIPDIFERIGDAPAFFFIDPFGTKDIAFKALRPIFNRPDRTEVLITFQTDGIAKKAGGFRHEDSSDPVEREKARKFTQHLASALGIDLPKLREGWRETAARGDTTSFESRAVGYYLKRLRSNVTQFKFTKPFKVLYYSPKDPFKETPVCFHLVFATQHEKGLFEMNDAMVDALDAFYREIYGATLFPMFVAEIEQQTGRAAVQNAMRQQFEAASFTIDDVKRHCMQNTDCLLRGSEYRNLVLQMAKAGGELQKIDGGTPSNARTRYRFVPGPLPDAPTEG